MINCDNCIHNSICYLKQKYTEDEMAMLNYNNCEDFLDKDKIVELKFKTGEPFYYIQKQCTFGGQESELCNVMPSDCEWCGSPKCDKQYKIIKSSWGNYKDIIHYQDEIDNSFYGRFTTKEKAQGRINAGETMNKIV